MYKLSFILYLLALVSCIDSSKTSNTSKINNGDIIFQISKSAQSKAIQLATNSKYSHMGIIYRQSDKYFVFEAGKLVKLTPLNEWIERGENFHYVIKRLKDSEVVLTENALLKMKEIGEKFKGKEYDIYFEWSDERIYCSELVWKIYKNALNIEIGKVETLKDFSLDNPIVAKQLKERFDNNIPLNEKVVSPISIFNSEKLEIVDENWYKANK